jgi:molybdopterin-containing oxidoreductase family iron-sulfur binding subunit
LALGTDADSIYHLDRADVIVSLDADFLISGPGHLRYARDFARRRDMSAQSATAAEMNRLYVIECRVDRGID